MSRHRAALAWIAVVAWAGFIFLLSHQSRPPYPPGVSASLAANLGHLGAYFILALLLWLALRYTGLTATRAAGAAILLSLLYGISDEWHQAFIPGRYPDVKDVLLDVAGAALAMLAVALARRRLDSHRRVRTKSD